jgi:uncharacterized membrane protein YqhA
MSEKSPVKSQPADVPGGFIVRIVTIIPVAATMITSIALFIYGCFETYHFIMGLLDPHHALPHDQVLFHAIEIVDLFLLAVVVQVVSLGLYQLYFKQDLHLPDWLKVENLDDLKAKLVGVTITVLAVYFLGRALTWTSGPDVLYLGGGVAMIIVALTWFLNKMGH